jgi:hypothetical protein
MQRKETSLKELYSLEETFLVTAKRLPAENI